MIPEPSSLEFMFSAHELHSISWVPKRSGVLTCWALAIIDHIIIYLCFAQCSGKVLISQIIRQSCLCFLLIASYKRKHLWSLVMNIAFSHLHVYFVSHFVSSVKTRACLTLCSVSYS